ncbi:hypothetical protein Ddc_18508 [Ditylenchus destructor]|nr:hypothetical protein Ddc_18508 [Ditylenchus destructor]
MQTPRSVDRSPGSQLDSTALLVPDPVLKCTYPWIVPGHFPAPWPPDFSPLLILFPTYPLALAVTRRRMTAALGAFTPSSDLADLTPIRFLKRWRSREKNPQKQNSPEDGKDKLRRVLVRRGQRQPQRAQIRKTERDATRSEASIAAENRLDPRSVEHYSIRNRKDQLPVKLLLFTIKSS